MRVRSTSAEQRTELISILFSHGFFSSLGDGTVERINSSYPFSHGYTTIDVNPNNKCILPCDGSGAKAERLIELFKENKDIKFIKVNLLDGYHETHATKIGAMIGCQFFEKDKILALAEKVRAFHNGGI